MAKRSPILGYNHNVRYRGLIFHVQTEDSGLLSPHLFTHLFYEGVIISTRKLVYDAGADEGAIKSLMQAQHKAVMKDLKRGAFDDKMDTNLAGNAGLLPRGTKEGGAAEAEALRDSQPIIPMPQEFLTEPGIEIIRDSEPALPPPIRPGTEPIEPMEVEPNITQPIDIIEEVQPPPRIHPRAATPPPIPVGGRTKTPAPMIIQPRNAGRADTEVTSSRTITAEKQRGSGQVRVTMPPPPSADIDPATIAEDPATLAAAMFSTSSSSRPYAQESAPEIEIVADDPPRRRAVHDTEIEVPLPVFEDAPRVSDGVPQPPSTIPPPMQRPPLSASTLPPSRPVTRPPSRPALTPPTVLSRPITAEHQKARSPDESAAVEIYAPAPSGGDVPPGERDRPGQYAQYKRSRQFDAVVPSPSPPPPTPPRERSGSAPIPAGLGRPIRPPPSDSGSGMPQGRPLKPPSQGSQPIPRPVLRDNTPSTPPLSSGVPQPMGQQHTLPRGKPPTPNRERPPVGRTPTPPRLPSTQPIPRPVGSGGVVMTRPAVIVGAPAKSPTQRVRKAREEEGRGFGQGLISEKSLDEVILAYLSEDADDK